MRPAAAGRRGAALPFVLAALVVGAACAAAVAAVAREAGRAARGGAAAVQAAAGAEGALAAAVARWPARWNAAIAPGARVLRTVVTPAGEARLWAVRLDATRFALEAESRSADRVAPADGPAVRRRLLLVRLRHVAPAPGGAAVTAGGPVRVAAGAVVDGADQAPDGWSDCPPSPASPAPAAPVPAAVAAPEVHAEPGAAVLGTVRTDSASWAAALAPQFGDDAYPAHAARAHVALVAGAPLSPAPAAAAPGAAGAAWEVDPEPCARTGGSWGEPLRGGAAVAECVGALPLVHLRGAVVRLAGPARLQGTVLVDGDLVVEGPVRGAGVVVVRGAVDASAGALALDGALVAGGEVRLGAGSRVRASACAVARASAYAARAVALPRRAWAEAVR